MKKFTTSPKKELKKKCIKCWEVILPEEKKTIIPLDIPYVNLWVHKGCLLEIENLLEFLQKNYEKWYNYYVIGEENGIK